MRKNLLQFSLLLITTFLFSAVSWGQVIAWDFTGASSVTTWEATTENLNLSSSNLVTRGSGATASAGGNSFRTQGFQNNGISITNNDYFQITLSPSTNFEMSLSSIDVRVTGTSSFASSPGVSQQFAYSLNGVDFTLIGAPSVTVGTNQTFTVDLSGVSELQDVPSETTVTLRYYASGQTSTGGWGFHSNSSGNNGLAVNGNISPVSTANDDDTEIFAPLSQIVASTQIAADVTDEADSFSVLGFVVEDQASGDGLPTEVTRMRFVSGVNNTADWSTHIQGVTLLDENLTSYAPTVSILDTEIVLDFSTAITIADGESLEFELGAYLNTTNIIDGSVLQFQIDGDSSGFLADLSGSGFSSSFTLGDVVGNNHTIDVDASKLTFLQQPSDVGVGLVMSPNVQVAYTDANDNIDTDYDGTGFDISLTSSGSFDAAAITVAEAVNGVSTFSNLVFNAVASSRTITATDASGFVVGTYISNTFDVTTPPIFPTSGDLIITEVSDASNFNNEFIEFYNTTSTPLDMGTSKLVMQSDGTVWDFGDAIPSAVVPPNGFLIVTRGADQTTFEGDFGTLNANTVFVQGTTGMFFGTGTKRRWQLYEGGTANTADGTLIDDTVITVAGNDRDFFDFLTEAFVTTPESEANPGVIDNLVFETAAWKFNAKADATTGSSNVFFLDSFTATENVTMNNGEVSSTSVLDLDGNNLTILGNLTFKSDTSGSGQLADATGSTITGNVTAERFIPARRAFRFLSSPVGGVAIADSWQQNTHITGAAGTLGETSAQGFDQTESGAPSMFTYDHTVATQEQPWLPIASTTQNIVAGTPYRLFVRGDRTVSLANNEAPATDVTLSVTGNLHVGDYQVTISDFAENFTFIGNPYQAVVNLNSVSYGADVNSNFAYYWDPSLESAGGFVVVSLPGGAPNPGSSNADEFLRPGQAVFVRNNDSGTNFDIEITEAAKATSGNQTQVFSTSTTAFVNVRLYTTDKFNNGQLEEDAAGVRFYEDGNNAIDPMDAVKMGNPGVNLALVNGNTPLAIESRALPEATEEVQLFMNNVHSNNYTFRFHTENLPMNTKVFIKDAYLDTQTEVEAGIDTYSFTIDSSIEASASPFRFSFVFEDTTLSTDQFDLTTSVEVYPNPTTNVLNVRSKMLANQEVDVKILDVLGRSVQNLSIFVAENATIEVNTSELQQGLYFINVSTSTGETLSERFIKK